MKKIILIIFVSLFMVKAVYCQQLAQPLTLTVESDKQVYEVGDPVDNGKSSSDSIGKLVERLSKTYGMWTNGICKSIDLPATTRTEQVVLEVLKQRHLLDYKIKQIKEIKIPPETVPFKPYIAVLVQTDLGEKIVLIQYQGNILKWWNRIYDAGQDY